MAIRQYIGARYVPKFMGTYDPTQAYEALIVVDNGMGTSYISKIPVPANTPLTDTTYWTVYGAINGAIINLQNQIDEIKDAIVTPEMFGAVGDGLNDDTQAVNDALASGATCIFEKSYYITDSIIPPAHSTLIINGTITYDGANCAILMSNRYITIEGRGTVTSNGDSAIEITGARNTVTGLSISVTGNYTAAIHIHSDDGGQGVSYLHLYNLYIAGRDALTPYGNGLYLHSTNNGFINENVFESILTNFFINSIKLQNDSSNSLNRNKFIQHDSEGSTYALHAESSGSLIVDSIFDLRVEEFGNVARIRIDSHMISCTFKGRGFKPVHFEVLNPGAKALWTGNLGNNNFIEGFIYTNSGAAFGYNGSFHLNGDLVIFDVNSKRERIGYVSGDLTLSYSGTLNDTWPGNPISIYQTLATCVIDLNYLSDYNTSPLDIIEVRNPSGTTVSIVNDGTTLYPATALPKGFYKVIYDAIPTTIKLVQLTTI